MCASESPYCPWSVMGCWTPPFPSLSFLGSLHKALCSTNFKILSKCVHSQEGCRQRLVRDSIQGQSYSCPYSNSNNCLVTSFAPVTQHSSSFRSHILSTLYLASPDLGVEIQWVLRGRPCLSEISAYYRSSQPWLHWKNPGELLKQYQGLGFTSDQ